MIIISDTSPISNLLIIERLHFLPKIYQRVIIPSTVFKEIRELKRFGYDLKEFEDQEWIEIRDPLNKEMEIKLRGELDAGEASAIALAVEIKPTYLAIDEKKGRRVAESLGIEIIGLIGILIEAKELGIIPEVKPILDELRAKAGFRISDRFYSLILESLNEA